MAANSTFQGHLSVLEGSIPVIQLHLSACPLASVINTSAVSGIGLPIAAKRSCCATVPRLAISSRPLSQPPNLWAGTAAGCAVSDPEQHQSRAKQMFWQFTHHQPGRFDKGFAPRYPSTPFCGIPMAFICGFTVSAPFATLSSTTI